jgi:hypothetical protein
LPKLWLSLFCRAKQNWRRVSSTPALVQLSKHPQSTSKQTQKQKGLEVLGDLGLKFFRGGHGREACDGFPFFVDDELGEVPLDFSGFFFAWLFGLKPLVEVIGTIAVDFDFGEHREGYVVLRFGEFGDLCIGAGLLVAELVAREAEDGYAFGCIMKRTQTCVLRREASSRCDVYDQANLTGIGREWHCFARYGHHGEVGESSHRLQT